MFPQLVFFIFVLIDTGTSSYMNMIDFVNLVCALHIGVMYIRKFPLRLFQKYRSMNTLIDNFHSTLKTDINTLRTRQKGLHFEEDIFKCNFLDENFDISNNT